MGTTSKLYVIFFWYLIYLVFLEEVSVWGHDNLQFFAYSVTTIRCKNLKQANIIGNQTSTWSCVSTGSQPLMLNGVLVCGNKKLVRFTRNFLINPATWNELKEIFHLLTTNNKQNSKSFHPTSSSLLTIFFIFSFFLLKQKAQRLVHT